MNDPDGWLHPGSAQALEGALRPDMTTIIELGSWTGFSARFMLDRCKTATIYCVDTWEGGVEHKGTAALAGVYERFIDKMWEYRARVVPVRETTVVGLWALAEAGIKPDLIYVDAGHRYEDVSADLETIVHLFRGCRVVGDDYGWAHGGEGATVARAADEFAKRHSIKLDVIGGWAYRFDLPD